MYPQNFNLRLLVVGRLFDFAKSRLTTYPIVGVPTNNLRFKPASLEDYTHLKDLAAYIVPGRVCPSNQQLFR